MFNKSNMARPKLPRYMKFQPGVFYFKPQGIPLRMLEEIILKSDELEAVKLYEVDGLEQKAAAKKMKISQPTFARIIKSAYKKISHAIVEGKAIRIEKNSHENS